MAKRLAEGTLRLEHGARLRGKVSDREGNPRAGVRVRVFGPEPGSLVAVAERTAGQDGTFEGPSLAAGRYQVQAWSDRLLLTQEIEIPPDHEEWPLELAVGGVHLTGLVTRRGEPVASGSLHLRPALDPGERRGKVRIASEGSETFRSGDSETRLEVEVRGDGTFDVSDVPPGALRIDYTGPDSAPISRDVQLPDGPRQSLTLEVGGVPLRGRLLDRVQNVGVEGTLRVTDPNGSPMAWARSDAEGTFEVADLSPGRYNLEASAEGFVPRVLRDVEVGPASAPAEIALDRGETGSLRVRIERPDGSPAPWVSLALLDLAGRVVSAQPTDSSGQRLLQDLPAGTYVLVWADSFAGTGASEPFQIESGHESSFERALPEGSALQIHCDLDACGGEALQDLGVSTSSGLDIGAYLSGVSPALRFSSSGNLALGRLSPGSYSLRIGTQGRTWNKTLTVGGGETRISLP